jgi:hypothetical protein
MSLRQSTSYHLKLAPWGPEVGGQDLMVSDSQYQLLKAADAVCMGTPVSIERAELRHVAELVPLFEAYRRFYGQVDDARAHSFLEERVARQESVVRRTSAGRGPITGGGGLWSSPRCPQPDRGGSPGQTKQTLLH